MNIAAPWQDWEAEKCSVEKFKRRHQNVNKEMFYNIITNFIFCLLMTTPLLYTGKLKHLFVIQYVIYYSLVYQINTRHHLLERSIKPRPEEAESFNTAWSLQLFVLLSIVFLTLLEYMFFYIYNNKVKAEIIENPDN